MTTPFRPCLWIGAAAAMTGFVAAGEAAFAPWDVSGCVWWIEADAGVQAGPRGAVTAWRDLSGYGRDIDQVGGASPTIAAGLGDKPAVRFDGHGYLYGSHDFDPGTLTAHTLFLLARWTDPVPEHCQRILSSHTWNWAFGYIEGRDQCWYENGMVYNGDWSIYGPGSVNTAWHLHTGTVDVSGDPVASFWKDDTILMEERPPGIADARLTGPRRIELGAFSGGHQASRCEIAAAILYDRVLAPDELRRVWEYFSGKYGIATPVAPAPGGRTGPDEQAARPFPIAEGPFRPDWRSFRRYECPEWFRDAKFGIWAHWSPQCQPEQGDWYAFHMYRQGERQYAHHVEHYGHPSKFGYKDICNLWKAERWDPERLIRLYQRAGARYFVALANHHCNFDCWDSKYQPWNSVHVGPRRDIVGTWAEAARRHGLRFGVTVHSARAWEWYEVAHGSDGDGPLKGVPYDGAQTKEDGKGTWWEGYDPADLYGPHGEARTPGARQAYIRKWFDRTRDLVDRYRPDLLYFDDTVPPLGEAGMSVVAHFLNAGVEMDGGRIERVYTTKIHDAHPPKEIYGRLVNDFEGGRAQSIQEHPWQTDTCIGNWHYFRGIEYRTARDVVRELVDIVSKNGNLLLNIPLRGDGSIDGDEEKFLEELTAWMDIHGEGIHGTRPWKRFGEGSTTIRRQVPASPEAPDGLRDEEIPGKAPNDREIRFTAKGGAIYAFVLSIPEGDVSIRSLGRSSPVSREPIAQVALLGSDARIEWRQEDDALVIRRPERLPSDHAIAFRITLAR